MMRRFDDWPERLAGFLQAAAGRPFVWGHSDCCLFACDAVRAMTGEDPAAPFRGRYRSKAGAFAAMRAFVGAGGGQGLIADTAERIARDLDCREVGPLEAQRGDVVLTDQGPWQALGICAGARVAIAGLAGVEYQPLANAVRAWRI